MEKELSFKYLLEKYGGNPALIWSDGKLTYHQYFQQIDYISNCLKKEGIQPGSKVAVISEINYHFPILFFAILNLGGIVFPLNPNFPNKKIKEILDEFECDSLISINSSFTVKPESHVRVIHDIFEIDFPLDGKDQEKNILLFIDQVATIILTSGSGGNPKGVLHTIGNHYYSALGSNENIPLNSDDCWMVSLPFYHIAGIAILFRTLLAGAACYLSDRNKKFQEQLHHTKVTHISLVSTQLYRWLENMKLSESSIKAVLVGGSHIPETLIKSAIKKNLPVYTSYGSTEMSSQITTTSGDDLKKNPASSGKLLSYREIKIDKNCEILVGGNTLGLGYVSGDDIISFVDANGWYHTGDLGHFDDMDNIVVTGRLDNMFISGGENIHPEEIERHLHYYDHIIDVCVIDIPDAEFGARPVAFIKMESSWQINESDLKNYLKDKIPGFKIPFRFLPWPENLDTLKPDRKYLQKLASKNLGS
jgi:O-succinylbenzoic acid--CoA ligase